MPAPLNVPDPTSISAPASGADDVPADPEIVFIPSPGATQNLIYLSGFDPYSSSAQIWIVITDGNSTPDTP